MKSARGGLTVRLPSGESTSKKMGVVSLKQEPWLLREEREWVMTGLNGGFVMKELENTNEVWASGRS